jgi:hypothetical protein
MALHVLVNITPPTGFRWQLVERHKVLKSGTAKTKAEALAAGEAAKAAFER